MGEGVRVRGRTVETHVGQAEAEAAAESRDGGARLRPHRAARAPIEEEARAGSASALAATRAAHRHQRVPACEGCGGGRWGGGGGGGTAHTGGAYVEGGGVRACGEALKVDACERVPPRRVRPIRRAREDAHGGRRAVRGHAHLQVRGGGERGGERGGGEARGRGRERGETGRKGGVGGEGVREGGGGGTCKWHSASGPAADASERTALVPRRGVASGVRSMQESVHSGATGTVQRAPASPAAAAVAGTKATASCAVASCTPVKTPRERTNGPVQRTGSPQSTGSTGSGCWPAAPEAHIAGNCVSSKRSRNVRGTASPPSRWKRCGTGALLNAAPPTCSTSSAWRAVPAAAAAAAAAGAVATSASSVVAWVAWLLLEPALPGGASVTGAAASSSSPESESSRNENCRTIRPRARPRGHEIKESRVVPLLLPHRAGRRN